jgi:hypothetical protein
MDTAARLAAALIASAVIGGTASAQTHPLEQVDVPVHFDSGLVINRSAERDVIFSDVFHVKSVTWLRLTFDIAMLGEAPPGGQPTVLRITSLLDGARQHLTAHHLEQWRNTSAYFNGDTLIIEIIADVDAGPSRIASSHAFAGPPEVEGDRTICGDTDDRTLSDDPRVGRIMPNGCTGWLFDDPAHCFLTAGHCDDGQLTIVEFNVPLSNGNGSLNHPGPQDQYAVDLISIQSAVSGLGDDWTYFGCFPNSETDLKPYQAQGGYFTTVDPPLAQGQDLRVTGYGVTGPPVPDEWNQVQKTHVGPYTSFVGTRIGHQVDTTGGNSGSPIILESTGDAIGIHTNGGCNSGSNYGTGMNNVGLLEAIANPQGVCIPTVLLLFDYPDGLPEGLDPSGDTIRVVVTGNDGGEPQLNSGMLHYDIGDGFVSIPMQQVSQDEYDAVFPAIECGTPVDFYFSAETTTGETVFDPLDAPILHYSALAVDAFDYSWDDDFEQDLGWTVESGGGLSGGEWERGVPANGDRGDPPSDADGSGQCYLTENIAGNSDVDNGWTRLTSPVIDATQGDAHITYYRWYSNNTGGAPEEDIFVVEVSDDGGANWVELEVVGPDGPEVGGGWYHMSFRVADYVAVTDQFRIRFTASDENLPSVVEAAVDGVRLNNSESGYECEGTPCPEDLTGDGAVNVFDLLEVLGAWGACPGCPEDITGDGAVNVFDLLEVLGAWGPCG